MNLMAIPEQIIGMVIILFRRLLGVSDFNSQEAYFESLASWAAPLAAVIGLLLGVIAAIKLDSFVAFMAGLAWVLLICVGYHIGKQFLVSCKRLIANNPSSISSIAILESAGLIGILVLFGIIISSLDMAVELSNLSPVFDGFFAACATLYYISFMLNPQLISTTVKEHATAGDDAISIMVIFYKCAVKVAPIAFGTGLILGSIQLAEAAYKILSGEISEVLISEVLGGGVQSISGLNMVLGGLFYPLLISVSFCFFYLFADLCKAILTLHDRHSAAGVPPQ
jgi:hypothetical protein